MTKLYVYGYYGPPMEVAKNSAFCGCCGSRWNPPQSTKCRGIVMAPEGTPVTFNPEKETLELVETKNGTLQIHTRIKW